MADRFFPNVLPDFVSETTEQKEEVGDTLMKLLSMPYSSLSQHFKRAALDLKETVTLDTWGLTGQKVSDFTLYCGTLGTAFLLFKSYQLANNTNDLSLCLAIVDACNSASFSSRDVTFLCGRAGVCALGAVAAKHAGNQELLDYYLSQFKEIKLSSNLPDELLYGRAGFLWACVFLNKHLGEGTIPSTTTRAVVDEVIKNGRQLAKKGGGSPLMFEFYGEKYWGAAHGLAGIMHVLMDMELEPDEIMDVKGTLKYMIRNRFPSGNYPASEQDRKRDVLVHWCHGAPGIALTLVKAAELEAAVDAAEVVF
ncbi:GCR2-like 2 isoform 2, partial [Theobroma cacao]